jgi:hypothetical protein
VKSGNNSITPTHSLISHYITTGKGGERLISHEVCKVEIDIAIGLEVRANIHNSIVLLISLITYTPEP